MEEKANFASEDSLPMTERVPNKPQKPTRILTKIEKHKVNPTNDLLEIAIADEPGPGGANHAYLVYWPTGRGHIANRMIEFQNGPINENGVNGVTHEALLAIIEHRLEGFQAGPYANDYNAEALTHVRQAREALQRRTLERMARGVEGTMQK